MNKLGTTLAAGLLVLSSMTVADSPGVITTPGLARVLVAPDRLVIGLGLVTTSDTFSAATETARAISEQLKRVSVPDMSLVIDVDHDLAFIRLHRWGKGRKLQQEFRVLIELPPGIAPQDALVGYVDRAIRIDPKLTVENYRPSLSIEKTSEVRKRLLEEALADAHRSATILAEAAGLQLLKPRNINVGETESRVTGNLEYDGVVFGRALQRPFAVNADLGSYMQISLQLDVEFGVEPM